MKFDVDIEGFDALEKKLKQLEPRIQKRALQSAVTSAIRVGRKEIKNKTPRSVEQSPNSIKYGRMSDNLKVKRLRKTEPHEKAARVDTGKAFWALWYELGSSRQPARPFMANAFRASIPAMLEKFGAQLGKKIEQEAQKIK